MITHIVRPPPPPKTLFVVRLRGTQVLVYGDGAAEVDVGFFQVLLTRDGGSVSGIGNIGIFSTDTDTRFSTATIPIPDT